jgi:cytochrome c-type biogenesis protein CcmE
MSSITQKYKALTKKQRNTVVGLALLVVIVVCALWFVSDSMNGITMITPTQLIKQVEQGKIKKDTNVKLAGTVKKDSIKINALGNEVKFIISDKAKEVPIKYHGTVPNAFSGPNIKAEVDGTYDKNKNLFNAELLYTKCPSKYEAKASKSAKKKE